MTDIVTLQLGLPTVFRAVDASFVVGMGLLAFTVAAGAGAGYRLVMAEKSPWHFPIIIGVGSVGIWMNSAATIVEYVERTVAEEPVLLQQMETNSAAIFFAIVTAFLGARVGDVITTRVQGTAKSPASTKRIGTFVQAVGRFIQVSVPAMDDIQDIEAYEPIPTEVKEALSGETFRFPRGLTIDELHARVVDRIRDDYQVGHVDLELDETGEIIHLGLGSRPAGLGPTFPPRKGAIGLETSPAPGASPGDRIRVWRRGEEGTHRVGPADLRAVSDNVATVVMDKEQIEALEPADTVELVTLRTKDRSSLEFASIVRAANVTMDSFSVEAGSLLDGLPIGALRIPILGLRSPSSGMVPLPPDDTVLGAGDFIYPIGHLDELRKVRQAASS